MAIHDDAFEGVHPDTLRGLLDVLSFPLDIPKEGGVDPAKWIFDACSGYDGTVSSLLLMESGASTFSADISALKRLNDCCDRTFCIERDGRPVMDTPMPFPKSGTFIVLADFGFGEAVEIIGQARTGKRMSIKSLSFFHSEDFDERVRHTKTTTLSRMLERSLDYVGRMSGDPLDGQDALEAILAVVKKRESLNAALSSRDIRMGVEAPEDRPASDVKIRRSRV